MDIRTHFGETKFDVRACGFLIVDEQVLVSREEDGSCTLNGGAVKVGETSEQAVVREFKEETGLDVKADKLRAIIEHQFVLNNENYQQIIFVYALSLTNPSNQELVFSSDEKVRSSWIPLNKVNKLKPDVLNQLLNQTDSAIQHYSN